MKIGDVYIGENPVVLNDNNFEITIKYVLDKQNKIKAIVEKKVMKNHESIPINIECDKLVNNNSIINIKINNCNLSEFILKINENSIYVTDSTRIFPYLADSRGINKIQIKDKNLNIVAESFFEVYGENYNG